MRTARTLTCIATALTLAGCGSSTAASPGGDQTGQRTPQRKTLAASRVPAECPPHRKLTPPSGQQKQLAPLPRDFHPVAVLVCDVRMRDGQDDTKPWTVVKRRGDGGLERLVRQLRRPSAKNGGGPCTLELTIVPWFALIDARGEAFRPQLPTGECGKPRPQVMRALDDLRLKRVGNTAP